MRLVKPLLAAVAASLVASAAHAATTWHIDPTHSTASFKVKHMMVSNVTGTIGGLAGDVQLDDKAIDKSSVLATLDAMAISTGNTDRDKHLRSPDFFNAEKCQQIKFVSKSVTGQAPNLKVNGDLTMNCVTKPVALDVDGPTAPVKGMMGDMRRGLTATTKVDRKDFNIVWNKSLDGGGVVVGNDVAITLEIELTDAAKASHH